MLRWLKNLFRAGAPGDTYPDPPARLVDIPGQVVAPSADLLGRLREIEPYAEALYRGEGRWWLGRVREDSAKRPVGRQWAKRILEGDGFGAHEIEDLDADRRSRFSALQHALLLSYGWKLIADVTVVGAEYDGVLVDEFRKAMFVERGGTLLTDEELAAESARRDRIRENKLREREAVRQIFHPNTTRVPQFTGAGR